MEEGFWNDSNKAQETMLKVKALKEVVDECKRIDRLVGDSKIILEFLKEEYDENYAMELEKDIDKLLKEVEKFRIQTFLKGEYDANNAILSIHAGAGGVDAQEWAEILLRMYTRWCEGKKYSIEILNYVKDTEGGIKSVSILIKGINVYGYIKSEKGVHRLIRISPFDSSGKRHTSFASVDVAPEIHESYDIGVDPSDLKIDTYRASGAGGQHVNTTDSAIRITHIPTGIVVQCQNERSQHKNKDTAMKMLYSKLVELKIHENKEKVDELQGSYSLIGWGSQIRTYVFHPYSMVKDHRTDAEVGNVENVLDGDIDYFINEYLSMNAKKK